MKLEIFSFKDKMPKRGKIVCFNDYQPGYYYLDYQGNVWGFIAEECEYACQLKDLQSYGSYTHWARTDKAFKIDYNIPKEA